MLFSSSFAAQVAFAAIISPCTIRHAFAQATSPMEFAFTMNLDPPPMPGQPFAISWVPGDYQGNVNILLNSYISIPAWIPTTSIDIATDVNNTGSYIWNVPANTCGHASFSIEIEFEHPLTFSDQFNIPGPACATPTQSVYQTTQACTSTSSASGSQPTGGNKFIDQSHWIFPVVGEPMKVEWSPSSDTMISLELAYYGYVPDNSNSIWLTKSTPNTGSFTWDVPSNFTTGQYLLSIVHPGVLFDDTQVVIIGTMTPSLCGKPIDSQDPLSITESSTSPSSTNTLSSSPPSSVAFLSSNTIPTTQSSHSRGELFPLSVLPILATADYAQILAITTCSTTITPSYTSYVANSITTSFPIVGCSLIRAGSTITAAPGTCHSGDNTFSVSGTNIVCCPSAWETSSIGQLYCFSSASGTSTGRVNERNLGTTTNADIWGWDTATAVVTDKVFVKAETPKSVANTAGRVMGGLDLAVGFWFWGLWVTMCL